MNVIQQLLHCRDPYGALLKLASAAAAMASHVGSPHKAVVVVELDMKTEAGRIAKEAAERIRSLSEDLKSANERAQALEDKFVGDAEDDAAEADLQAALNETSGEQADPTPAEPEQPPAQVARQGQAPARPGVK